MLATKQEVLSCMVVDDDPLFLTIIKGLIRKTSFLKLEGAYSNPIAAGNALIKTPVDLVYLDIEMPEMTGFELLASLSVAPQTVLVSSKKEYALEAFDFKVTDYLLKPIDNYQRFLKSALKAKANLEKKNARPPARKEHRSIFVKDGSKFVKLCFEDIIYLEAFGDFVKVKTIEKNYVVYATLKSMIGKLPNMEFIQVHRSFIVRVDKIENLDMNNIQIGKSIIPISRSFKNGVLQRITML